MFPGEDWVYFIPLLDLVSTVHVFFIAGLDPKHKDWIETCCEKYADGSCAAFAPSSSGNL